MTSKLVVNTIEADTGISSVSFASSISLSSTSVFHLGDAGLNIGADTNISRAGNGILAFNINGGEKVRIDSSGNLDIATGQLTISNDIKSSDDDFYVYSYKGGSDGQLRSGIHYDGNSQRLRFFTGTNERLSIDSSGNVLLGTTDALTILSDGKIGIGTNAPSAKIEVQDRSGGTLIGLSVGTQYGNASFGGYNNYPAIMNGSSQPLIYCDTNNDRTEFFGDTVGFGTTCAFRVNGAERMRISKDGHVTKAAHPSFSAKGVGATFSYFANNNAWYSLGDTVLTNTSYKNDQNFITSHSFGMNRGVLSNGNSCFNADTTVFTAPVDGFYHFCISLYLRASAGGGTCHIGPWINNSNTNIYTYNGSDTTAGDLSYPPATRTIDVKLSAGDTFFWAVYAVGTNKFSIYQDYSYISGYLIG